MSPKPMKPGTNVPVSGIYREVGPGELDKPRRVTCIEGQPLPPTTEGGRAYILDKATKRKAVRKQKESS